MTIEKFGELLKTTDLEVAYHHFQEKQSLPYVVYALTDDDDFNADNEHYVEIHNGYVELYSVLKDFKGEQKIKQFFKDNKIAYSKVNEDYIETEELFFVRWEFQFINGGNN